MPLDATPGSQSANSYATVAEADAYHLTRLHNAQWSSATNDVKEAALIWAARLLDQETWKGYRSTELQAMRWPRYDVVDADGYTLNGVPRILKDSQSELAFLLLQSDRTADSGTEGFSRIKVDVLELEIDKFDRVQKVSPAVASMLRPLLATGTRMERG
jgi:hypothetical protein